MPKTKISEFSSTPGNNTDIDGINIAEGCAPSGINDAIRELMAQLKDWQSGTSNDPMVIGSSGSLTLSYGTANGVAYLNGSKVLTTGSALTFDGTTLATTGKFGITGSGSIPTASALEIGTNGAGTRFRYNVPTGGEHNFTENGSVISFQTASAHGWFAGGPEQMRLTSTGLGIGTSSPNYRADILASNFRGLRVQSSGDDAIITMGSQIASSQYWSIAATSNTSGQGSNRFIIETTDANAGGTVTPRLTIDSSGNVGIGTSSPATRLQVNGQTRVSDGTTNIDIVCASATGFIGTQTNAPLVLRTNDTERARIDSSGRVTMPFQPAFHAERNTAFNASSGVIVFENAPTNIGSHYNTSTGRFTAPVAGTYIFFVSFFTNITNAPIDFRIVVNGVSAGGNATTGTTSVARDCHAHLIRTLAVNDYVEIQAAGFGTNIPGGIGIFQNFSGRLVS